MTESRQEEFFAWMVRLPKTHGKRHGKNRHAKRGVDLDKNDEIAAADARDAEIIEEIRGKDLSVPQKRALIAEKLTPRLGAASEGRGPTTGIGRIPADANPIMALSCHGALMACKPLPQAARRLQP